MSAVVTGWGDTTWGGSQHAIVMREVTVRTQSTEQCQGQYGPNKFHESMICAETAGKSPCEGDSGGPLAFLGQNDSYSQVGVVSWMEKGCAEMGYPAVFTRVTSFLDWIRERMTPRVQGQGKILSHPHTHSQLKVCNATL